MCQAGNTKLEPSIIKGEKAFNANNNTVKIDQNNAVFRQIIKTIADTRDHIFISGSAGTGKSTLIEYLRQTGDGRIVTLAPTGAAAMMVGGRTIHSFCQLPKRIIIPNDDDIKYANSDKIEILKNIDTIIIDEISMVSADVMDGMDQYLRKNLRSGAPFGGKRLVMVGDVFQLEPVPPRGEMAMLFANMYESGYFFSSRVFSQISPKFFNLTHIYRQNDAEFIEILNRIRMGDHLAEDVRRINRSAERVDSRSGRSVKPGITICSKNKDADYVNNINMMLLAESGKTYVASRTGVTRPGDVDVPEALELKVGAQIMTVVNSSNGYYVNGSLGKVTAMHDNFIEVLLDTGKEVTIFSHTWEITDVTYNKSTKKIETEVVGTYSQLPVKLAWAISIHKSQGMTFSSARIDLGFGNCFASGMAYVALSRCKSLEHLVLRRPLRDADILVNTHARTFFEKHFPGRSSEVAATGRQLRRPRFVQPRQECPNPFA